MTKTQEIKCLFEHHDFFQRGMIRQCIHCKLVQIMDIVNGTLTNPKWITSQAPIDIDFDLKEIDNMQKQLEEVKQYNIGIKPVQLIISSAANSQWSFLSCHTYASTSPAPTIFAVGVTT